MEAAASTESREDEEPPDDSATERLAAQLLEVPSELCGVHHNSHLVASGNKTASNLLEFTALTNLFNRLHLCGMQQRALPTEFNPACITSVLLTVKPILNSEPLCLEIASPVVLFGDLHGEFHILVKLTDLIGKPPQRSYLFLGDYVDRGPHSLETLLYLFLFKSLHPNNVFILRGNHEDRRVYRFFNFEDDLVRIFGLVQGQNLSSLINTVLCYLPLCAIVNHEIFCCHGGLSPHFNHPRFATSQQDFVRCLNLRQKPLLFHKWDFAADLLWADPLDIQTGGRFPNLAHVAITIEDWFDKRLGVLRNEATSGTRSRRRSKAEKNESLAWMPNPRGCSYVFNKAAFNEFMHRFGLQWMVRAHMFVSKGYQHCFDGRCITLFSAADYAQKYHNTGALIVIDAASNGKDFPGRYLRFSKRSLLKFAGTLRTESKKWPHEIFSHEL